MKTRSRSSCQCYEEGEKSSKSFLNLENFNGTQSQICKIIVNDQEITDPNKTTSSPSHLFAIRGRRKRGPGTLQTRD